MEKPRQTRDIEKAAQHLGSVLLRRRSFTLEERNVLEQLSQDRLFDQYQLGVSDEISRPKRLQ